MNVARSEMPQQIHPNRWDQIQLVEFSFCEKKYLSIIQLAYEA